MTITALDTLFLNTLKDLLYAERKILRALPRMERKATDPKLREAFSIHCDETEEYVVRLEKVFELLGKPARGAKCDAMVGLIEEAEGVMADIDDPETMDAALISLVQAVKHYEIARYGMLVAWATQLGNTQAAAVLKSTLDEARLNAIAAA